MDWKRRKIKIDKKDRNKSNKNKKMEGKKGKREMKQNWKFNRQKSKK